MLGLRRYRFVQIDVWQGEQSQFAVDGMLVADHKALDGSHSAVRSTKADKLPAQWVLQATGPRWMGGGANEASSLKDYYEAIFQEALRLKISHLSLPAIFFGFPPVEAAKISFQTLKYFLDQTPDVQPLRRLTFVASNGEIYKVLQDALFEIFEDEQDEFDT